MNRPAAFRSKLAFLYIGFGSILSQIIIVREFLVAFYGNELSIGIVFAAWMAWIGAGSFFGGRIAGKSSFVIRLFRILLAMAPVITFAQILLIKSVRAFLNLPPGEFLSMTQLFICSLLILSPGCLVWGMLFSIGAKSSARHTRIHWLSLNNAYIYELFGSVFGGLIFSFLIVSLLSVLQTILLLILTGWIITIWIFHFKKISIFIYQLFAAAVLFFLLLEPARGLEHSLNDCQWSLINDKLTFINSIDSRYQRISLLQLGTQFTVYADGRPAFNIPAVYDAEMFSHAILVHKTVAYRALILGGGLSGLLREVLKYRVKEIDYIEIDPSLVNFVEPYLDQMDRQALKDPRVNIITGDGREYLGRTDKIYDIILLNIGEPSTANANRYFTLEFHSQCLNHLSDDGIFAFSFPSSTEYLADELKDLNVSLYKTLRQTFKNTILVPGVRATLIGSRSGIPLISGPDSLAKRYRESGISAEYFSEYQFYDLMQPERVKSITGILESAEDYKLNTDNNPVTYYFNMLLWNHLLHSSNQIFSSIRRPHIFIFSVISILALLAILLRSTDKGKTKKNISPAIIIICCSIVGMALNLLLLLNFQESFGSVYEMVGAVIAANMLGMALGTFGVARFSRDRRLKSSLLIVLLSLAIFTFLIPLILNASLLIHSLPFTLSMVILSGALVGNVFGLVNRKYLKKSDHIGSFYAYDLLGSSVGALTTCSLLLPILGIQEAAYLLTLIILPAAVAAIKE